MVIPVEKELTGARNGWRVEDGSEKMTDRGIALMKEFTEKYPKTEGAAENWWNNLSNEDKQEVTVTIQNMITAINQVWEAMRVAIVEASEAFSKAFAAFSEAWNKEKENEI
jgi:hypothetical protein